MTTAREKVDHLVEDAATMLWGCFREIGQTLDSDRPRQLAERTLTQLARDIRKADGEKMADLRRENAELRAALVNAKQEFYTLRNEVSKLRKRVKKFERSKRGFFGDGG